MAFIEEKVGEFSIAEAFAIGISKSITEQLLAPVIGNGNYQSGAIKLVMAWAIPKYILKNSIGKTVATGMAVDGVEDVLRALFSDSFGNSASENGMII